MSHIDVMKQALRYLQDNQHLIADNERHAYVMKYNAFIERFAQAIADAEKQQALDKMADNARELGLDYVQMTKPYHLLPDNGSKYFGESWDKVEKPAPAQQDIPDLIAGALGVSRGTAYDMMREALAEQPDRQALQAAGIHPAPCARHCEANAFEIAARGMRKQITELQEARAEQPLTPEQTLDWLAQQHYEQCREERPIQHWIRKMKEALP